MPKRSAKKELAVDGTAKLAARSEAGDKHDKKNLTIEEATVASPRSSRKRTGDFFDFEDGNAAGVVAESKASGKGSTSKAEKPVKKVKTSTETKPKKEPKKKPPEADEPPKSSGDLTKDDAKPSKAQKSEDKNAVVPQASTAAKKAKTAKSEKQTKSAPAAEKKTVATEGDSKAEATKKTADAKSKTSKNKGKEVASAEEPPIAPEDAMDPAPFDNLLDSDKRKSPLAETVKEAVPKAKGEKAKKSDKKPTKNSTKSAAKEKEVSEGKSTKKKSNAKDEPASVKEKGTKSSIGNEDAPQAVASKSKKRKVSATDEVVKSDVLDPLAEHATESAKKKQKQSRKSLTASVGEYLASGFDAASGAVRSSLGGLGFGAGADGKTTTSDKSEGQGQATDTSPAQPADEGVEDSNSDVEPDDQTARLLAGFDSEDDEAEIPEGAGYTSGAKMPALPNAKKTAKKLKAITDAGTADTPGVVYVGRIPHGFYEHEMRDYFSQFGPITRLRLSRSRKTGRSKHYAFIEFASSEVARIVADTMDNYLLFGHILKCKPVAPGDVHEGLWKGANKRFKQVPWNKLEGRKIEMPVERAQWKKREEKELKRRAEKAKKTKEVMDYEYEGEAQLRSVDDLPVREAITQEPDDAAAAAAAAATSSSTALLEDRVTKGESSLVTAATAAAVAEEPGAAAVVVSEEVKVKKGKKMGKSSKVKAKKASTEPS